MVTSKKEEKKQTTNDQVIKRVTYSWTSAPESQAFAQSVLIESAPFWISAEICTLHIYNWTNHKI